MEESANKKKSNVVLYIAIFVLLVSAAFVVYMVMNPEPAEEVGEQTEEVIETDEEAVETETEETIIFVEQPQAESEEAENVLDTTEYKTQIDKDLQTLDSLDLSGAENDFSDDNIPNL